MQLSTGHSVMQIGAPLQPVQASFMIANIFGFRFLCTLLFAFSPTAMWVSNHQILDLLLREKHVIHYSNKNACD